MKPMKLWAELRRRRVIRFAGVYIVGAWLVFQVADVFFPAWGIPDAALQYLLYAAIGCFPVALVFSWFFDVTTSGITRTPGTDGAVAPDLSLKRPDYLLLGALLLLAGGVLYQYLGRVVDSAGEVPVTAPMQDKPPNSIAVLPFDNLDPNPDTGYFSDGVSEEILHRLSTIKTLTVIAQTSSFALARGDLGLDHISNMLGVRYLLNGSIRRAGDQVRVTARLVDDQGVQLWSETFDGNFDAIFEFQDTIAEKVASRVTRELVVLKTPDEARMTSNPEAYSQYLIGREYFRNRPPNWHEPAAEAYRRAIELDPDFAPPYAGLAIAVKLGAPLEEGDDKWSVFNHLIDRALELDPDLAEAWLAKGMVNTGEPGFDPERNVAYLEKALELDPGRAITYSWLAIAMAVAGRDIQDWMPIRDRGLELDPLNPPIVLNNSDKFLARSDFEGWKRMVSRLLDLPEPPGMVFEILAGNHAEWGRYSEAVHWARELLRAHLGRAGWHWGMMAANYAKLGMHEQADRWVIAARRHFPEDPGGRFMELFLRYVRGQFGGETVDRQWLADFYESSPGDINDSLSANILATAGQWSDVIELLESEVQMPDEYTENDFLGEDNFDQVHLLAYAYENAGRQDKAAVTLTWAEKRFRFLDARTPFHDNPANLIDHALHFAATGDRSKAAEALRKAVDAGWRDYFLERRNPSWRGAWESPEFAPIIEEIVADLERQRAEVEAADAEHDFLAEMESLVSQ